MSVCRVLISHLVDGDGHVSRLFGTRIQVAVVLGKKVDIVEDEAVVATQTTSLNETDVQQHRSVELHVRRL